MEAILVFVASAALTIPCVWQDHIEAGDLSSHVYNAWLAGEIERSEISGLILAHPLTNVLTDWPLQRLLTLIGAAAAERIVTGVAVVTFFWGAFFLASVISERRAWILAPVLAMISYGLIFHLGFLNFYLSTGLSLWLIGLLWRFSLRRAFIAAPLVLLACAAHVMPAIWAISVVAYSHALRPVAGKMRPIALLGALVSLVALQSVLIRLVPARWSLAESVNVLGLSGADQVRLFDAKYLIVVAGLVAIWCMLFLERLDVGGMLADPIVHLWILQIAAYILMPSAIQLPQYKHVFAFIPERISLFNSVILCAVLARARYGRGITRISAGVATLFFTFLFIDVRAYDAIENEIANLASRTPSGARFVAEVSDSNSRLSPLLHAADWACIGHCYSYANYEPATGQFRIQVTAPNSAVAPDMRTVQDIEEGRHIVTPQEAPIYSVCRCDQQNPPLCLRRLDAGEKTCSFSIPITWGLPWRPN